MDVLYTDYAAMRMRQRDVLEEEVQELLYSPRTEHKQRKDGRREARGRVNARTLLVVYSRSSDVLTVINVMWE